MVFILIHNCSLLQKSSVKAMQITIIRPRWDWVNWLEVVSLWSLLLAGGGQFSPTEKRPQRADVSQIKLLNFSPLPTLYFCLSFTWVFSLTYSCMKCHQNYKENGWIWLPCDTLFCSFSHRWTYIYEYILNVTEHGQEGWCDLFLGKEPVTLLQIRLPPIFMIKISKVTFAEYSVFPASSFWIINFWKER